MGRSRGALTFGERIVLAFPSEIREGGGGRRRRREISGTNLVSAALALGATGKGFIPLRPSPSVFLSTVRCPCGGGQRRFGAVCPCLSLSPSPSRVSASIRRWPNDFNADLNKCHVIAVVASRMPNCESRSPRSLCLSGPCIPRFDPAPPSVSSGSLQSHVPTQNNHHWVRNRGNFPCLSISSPPPPRLHQIESGVGRWDGFPSKQTLARLVSLPFGP